MYMQREARQLLLTESSFSRTYGVGGGEVLCRLFFCVSAVRYRFFLQFRLYFKFVLDFQLFFAAGLRDTRSEEHTQSSEAPADLLQWSAALRRELRCLYSL